MRGFSQFSQVNLLTLVRPVEHKFGLLKVAAVIFRSGREGVLAAEPWWEFHFFGRLAVFC